MHSEFVAPTQPCCKLSGVLRSRGSSWKSPVGTEVLAAGRPPPPPPKCLSLVGSGMADATQQVGDPCTPFLEQEGCQARWGLDWERTGGPEHHSYRPRHPQVQRGRRTERGREYAPRTRAAWLPSLSAPHSSPAQHRPGHPPDLLEMPPPPWDPSLTTSSIRPLLPLPQLETPITRAFLYSIPPTCPCPCVPRSSGHRLPLSPGRDHASSWPRHPFHLAEGLAHNSVSMNESTTAKASLKHSGANADSGQAPTGINESSGFAGEWGHLELGPPPSR